jgi:hypothetical protein
MHAIDMPVAQIVGTELSGNVHHDHRTNAGNISSNVIVRRSGPAGNHTSSVPRKAGQHPSRIVK